jgi:hypothetical protein
METKSCMSDMTVIEFVPEPRSTLITSEWQVRVWRCRYRGGTAGLTPSNQTEVSYHKPFPKHCRSFHLIQNRAEARTAFNSAEPRLD